MIKGMAMRNKAAHCHRIEVRPKGNRSRRRIIDVHGLPYRLSRLWQGTRNIQGVVPFWLGQSDTVYLGDQHMILVDVERMVSKRAIEHRPFFVVTGHHVGE